MEFLGSGFLSVEAEQKQQEFIHENQALIAAFHNVNNEFIKFIKLQTQVVEDATDGKRQIIALALAARLIEIYQSAYLQFIHGMFNELKCSHRIFLDAYFILANVVTDSNFVSEYFKSDMTVQLKLMDIANKHDDELFNEAKEYATEELREKLKTKIDVEKAQKLISFNNATNVGCQKLYDSLYRLTSAAIHSSPRSLEKYVKSTNEETITSILLGPELSGPDVSALVNHFGEISYRLIVTLQGLMELFGSLDQELIQSLFKQLEETKNK